MIPGNAALLRVGGKQRLLVVENAAGAIAIEEAASIVEQAAGTSCVEEWAATGVSAAGIGEHRRVGVKEWTAGGVAITQVAGVQAGGAEGGGGIEGGDGCGGLLLFLLLPAGRIQHLHRHFLSVIKLTFWF